MDSPTPIHSQMMVEDLLTLYPQVAPAFLHRGMACVGCPVAAFETVEEVAGVYGHDAAGFLRALRACASRRAGAP